MITLLKISKALLYASLACVLVVMSSTFFPFIGGKYYFFRVSTELSLIALILWWAFEAKAGELEARLRRLFRQPLFVAVSFYVLAYLLATLFADNVQGAFWSNFERGDGGFQMLHYYLFFVLLGVLFDHERDWRFLFYLSIVVAGLMIAYGVLAAAFVPNFIGQYQDGSGNPLEPTTLGRLFTTKSRFQGSLGNPAYVDPYLIFAMFYALYVWLAKGGAAERRKSAFMYGAILIVFLTFFILGQTRGAFLGLGAGMIVFFLYLVVTERRFRRPVFITLVALFLVVSTLVRFREVPAIKNLPGSRVLFTDISEDSAQTRFWTWGSAWNGFLERPVFGWGPENFSTVFDRYFDTRHYKPGSQTETWFDRAHSVIFDSLAETGILGFGAFIGVFVVFYREFFRHRWRLHHIEGPHATSPFAPALIFAVPIAYLVQGFVLFDVLPIYLTLFLFLAFATFMFHAGQRTTSSS